MTTWPNSINQTDSRLSSGLNITFVKYAYIVVRLYYFVAIVFFHPFTVHFLFVYKKYNLLLRLTFQVICPFLGCKRYPLIKVNLSHALMHTETIFLSHRPLPFILDGNVALAPSYDVNISQLVRLAWIWRKKMTDHNIAVKDKLLHQGCCFITWLKMVSKCITAIKILCIHTISRAEILSKRLLWRSN